MNKYTHAMNADDNYWLAEHDPEQTGHDYRWKPSLQLSGTCQSLDVWFRTKAECLDFIRKQIIGATLEED